MDSNPVETTSLGKKLTAEISEEPNPNAPIVISNGRKIKKEENCHAAASGMYM